MRKIKVAATQMSCSRNREETLNKAEKMVREAARKGTNIILLQEFIGEILWQVMRLPI